MAELTYRLFMVATVGMLAGTVFLLASSREVDPKHRRGVYISALVTGIAWYHYNKMTGSWAGGDYDTGLRYVDWILTVPLMFVEVLAVTSSGAEYNEKVRNWGLAATVMIGAGYYGETSSAGSDNYWVGFVVAMVAYAYLMRNLQAEGAGLKAAEADQFEKIKNLILVGWIIYPLGYLAPVAGDFDAIREVLYTIADIIRNQLGGAAIVMGALSPRTRNSQVEMYENGDVNYLVATDAIGMGLNLQIQHVAFASIKKFDGTSQRYLTDPEIAQIAGRAGRFLSDGTFGLTGDADDISELTIDSVENSKFEQLSKVYWRNSNLCHNGVEWMG